MQQVAIGIQTLRFKSQVNTSSEIRYEPYSWRESITLHVHRRGKDAKETPGISSERNHRIWTASTRCNISRHQECIILRRLAFYENFVFKTTAGVYRLATSFAPSTSTTKPAQSAVITMLSLRTAVNPKRDKRRTTKLRMGSRKEEYTQYSELTAPLSVLTEDFAGLPVRDMETWVNRSIDVRRNESAHQKGYVSRPLNAFMLYRMAYSRRTMKWHTENRQQALSKLLGRSWAMETTEIRALYENLAAVDKRNHMEAFPSYKFLPRRIKTKHRPGNSRALSSIRTPVWKHCEASLDHGKLVRTESDAVLHPALRLELALQPHAWLEWLAHEYESESLPKDTSLRAMHTVCNTWNGTISGAVQLASECVLEYPDSVQDYPISTSLWELDPNIAWGDSLYGYW
jgi:hypothetical protein